MTRIGSVFSSSTHPTRRDILALTAYLPRLYAKDLTIADWPNSHPKYAPMVKEFFHLAGQPVWCDYNYDPIQVGALIQDDEYIRTCRLVEIKTLPSWCVRREHFCNRYWAVMIRRGYLPDIGMVDSTGTRKV